MNQDYVIKVMTLFNEDIETSVTEFHTPEECYLVNAGIGVFLAKSEDTLGYEVTFPDDLKRIIHSIGHIIFDLGRASARVDAESVKNEVGDVSIDDFKDNG